MGVVSSVLTTEPASEPVTTAEVKANLRLETTADDTLIDALIVAARMKAETFLGKGLITQTWTQYMDCWPQSRDPEWWDGVREGSINNDLAPALNLAMEPVIAITHVKTYASDDTATTMADTGYRVDNASSPARLILREGNTWPLPGRTRQGIEVAYTVGYGSAASAVPRPIRQAIIYLASHLYENREPIAEFGVSAAELPFTVTSLLAPYRKMKLGGL